MSWAMIKHALNSSLGRQDFMPLNEQIKSMRALYASAETYYTHKISLSFSGKTEQTAEIPVKFQMTCDGTAYFCVVSKSTSSAVTATLKVYKNSEFLTSYTGEYGVSDTSLDRFPVISFSSGDIFSFEQVYSGEYNDTTQELVGMRICGTIKENNVVKIL